MPSSDVIRVLVVDDDARVRRALHDLIDASGGMRVVATAGDASNALRADESAGPAVALVDVLLPDGADGIGVVRELALRGRPVVASSVSAAVRNDAVAAGARCFVEKAPDAHRLLSALRHSAERQLDEMTGRGHVGLPMWQGSAGETTRLSNHAHRGEVQCQL